MSRRAMRVIRAAIDDELIAVEATCLAGLAAFVAAILLYGFMRA